MIDKQNVMSALNRVADQGLVLLVGLPDGDGIVPHRVPLNQDAADAFREQCQQAISVVSEADPLSYTASSELDTGQFFLIDRDDDLSELGSLRSLAVDVATRDRIEPSRLDTRILLYGIALGDDDRVVFAHRTDPRVTHQKGRFFAIGEERLAKLSDPVFSFSSGFDFILTTEWAVILNQGAFEKLFRETGLIQRNVGTWVSGITDHLPMAEEHVDTLKQVALRDSRTWRRLRDIQRRGHLVRVGLEDVSRYAKHVGLDEATIVRDGQLVFDKHQRFSFLQLLAEDLYRGELTDQVFEAQRKESV